MKRKKLNNQLMMYENTFNWVDKRTEVLEGITYTVVPVVMMVEGVHSGSRGPMLHTGEELGTIPEAWNGRPIVISHPVNEDGQHISANIPQVLENSSVGFVFNAYFKENKLVGEAWVNMDRLKDISPEAYAKLENNEVTEVSVGMFSEEELVEGQWNGETYQAIAHNYRPDHLALLPNATGACSIEDGCGLLVNKEGDVDVSNSNRRKLNEQGYIVNETNKLSIQENMDYMDVLDKLRSKIYAQDSENSYYYLIEAHDNYVIYSNESNGAITYYMQAYQTAADGNIEWVGARTQVVKEVTYRPVPVVQNKVKQNKKEVEMSGNAKCPQCIEKVNALIANEATQYVEEDRSWLEGLELNQLEKMAPKEATPVVNAKPDTTAITKEQAFEALGIKNPTEFQAQMNFGLSMYRAQVAKMVETIIANTENVWKKEELEAMDFNTLQKIASTVKTEAVVDYSVFGAAPKPVVNSQGPEVEPLPLIGYELSNETKK